MSKTVNILFCGVGGQGLMLSSTIIANALFESGFDVKKSEIHGMSQRGGSIISFIRYGDSVGSPIFDKGECDIMVSFEKIEAVRNIDYLNNNSKVVFNEYSLPPTTVYFGDFSYPTDEAILTAIKEKTEDIKRINAYETALKLGNEKITNTILVGYLSQYLPVKKEKWNEIMQRYIKPKWRNLNIEAFEKGGSL